MDLLEDEEVDVVGTARIPAQGQLTAQLVAAPLGIFLQERSDFVELGGAKVPAVRFTRQHPA